MERKSMLKRGRMKEIMEEIGKARVDVVAVQEIRLQGQGRIDKKDFSLFYIGPKERTGRNGTGFIINTKNEEKFSFFRASSWQAVQIEITGKIQEYNSHINISSN
jgi:exonuclease III